MEKIYHFMCGECQNWWSHATDMVYRYGHNMTCPHCGEKRGLIKQDEYKTQVTQFKNFKIINT